MEYLVKVAKKKPTKGSTVVTQRIEFLYVADTHTFDLKGKQNITLTDLKEYAQEFTLEEATDFIKTHKQFVIEEVVEEEDEYYMEDEDNE